MRVSMIAGAAVLTGLGVRVVRSRHRRFLHPDGRTFAGEMTTVDGDRYSATVRVSKGAGTGPGRADVLGLAVRVHRREPADLLLSTAGTGRFTRYVPMPRRSFDTVYGSILPYRTASGRKVHLLAEPDPDGPPLGDSLESVSAAAAAGTGLLLSALGGTVIARVAFGSALPDEVDAALAFDPIRNAPAELHPAGAIHHSRALAYRLSQRWRQARPTQPAPERVTTT
ncbi:MAG: hypothetical protein ABW022_07425 [Actinoplanes sp.]